MPSAAALLLVPWVVACAGGGVAPGPAPSPAPPTNNPRSEPAGVVRWGELTQELATQLRRAGLGCPAVAKTIDAFVTAHQAELRSTQGALVAWEAHAPERDVKAFYAKVFPAVEVRIDAGIRCKRDKASVEAFDRFFHAAGLDLR